ncbi:NUDIX hydrolase [Streptomyces iconiensis]|uniref:NUDIX hydrolase n=1 Tax=Streptomyces iconiensis TaxID=1384038 RepID=A0ABT6ZXZ8_9ACTN|nr:NUDIX hydrolase [Streptomyces iconiensis]MDJ1133942.1 NUDIX hydrolase [Streptomyces iconiensis]
MTPHSRARLRRHPQHPAPRAVSPTPPLIPPLTKELAWARRPPAPGAPPAPHSPTNSAASCWCTPRTSRAGTCPAGTWTKGARVLRAACEREVHEELGLAVAVSPEPLVTAWVSATDRPPHLYRLFDGGRLTADQQGAVRLQHSELTDWRFFPPETTDPEVIPPSLRPIWNTLKTARITGRPAYLEVARQGGPGSGERPKRRRVRVPAH